MAKWIIGIIVVGLAGLALWWSGWLGGMTSSQTATTTPQTAQPQAQAPAAPTNGMSATNDASDVAVSQDAVAIDAQMQGLTTDSAAVDASLNDKPVTQSY